MSWKDLNNDLSDPSFSRMTFPNAPDSIITKFMAKGIFNFFPFKVVNLKWLIDSGKATQAPVNQGYQKTNCGVYYFYAMTFNKEDNYLPVGDVIINMEKAPENGRWCPEGSNPVLDLTKVFVLLVKNNSKYSTIIKDADWKFVSRSRSCNGTEVIWSFRAIVNNNRQYNSDYNVIGDSFKTWNHPDSWWIPGNSCLLPNNTFNIKERPIAAVHTNFLAINKSKSKYDTDVKSFELNGDFSCAYKHFLSATSPFNTFNVSADEDTGGRGRNTDDGYWGDSPAPGDPKYWPKYKFYDIIPEFFPSDCCAGILPQNSEMWQCGRYSDSTTSTCANLMTDFCVGDNLTKDNCKKYCKGKDCDDRLTTFCGAGTYDTQKTKYEKYPEVCSCFMPRNFYETKDNEYYSKMGAAGQQLVTLLKASGVYGGNPECSDLQCKFGGTTLQHSTFKANSCPNINIQNCINEQATTNKGTLKAGTIDQSQANNCVQQTQTVNNTTQQAPPPQQPQQVQPPSITSQQAPTQGNNKMLVYGAIAFIILLLIILLIVLLM